MKKIAFATKNKTKSKRFSKGLLENGIEIVSLLDLGLDLEIKEDGKNAIENALIKARECYKKTNMPTIGMDDNLYLENVPEDKQPGVYVRRVNGKTLNDEEMIEHYINLVKEYGTDGKLDGKWIYGLAVINENGEENTYTWVKDDFYMVETVSNIINPGYPLNSISKYKKLDKYFTDVTKEDKEQLKVDESDVVKFIVENINRGKKMELEELYEVIRNDENILQRYNQIQEIEIEDKGEAFHNFEHIKNVTSLVEKILIGLNCEKDFISKAKIACILHDTGAIEGKENHAYRSYEFAKEYFKTKDIQFDGIDEVLEAIKTHSNGFDTENKIALALILSDKLDIKKSRISEEGRNIIGTRQYAHIEDIDISINNKAMEINFYTDKKIDLKELNEYYFTKKVFRAVETFSKKFDLDYKILLDKQIWKIE